MNKWAVRIAGLLMLLLFALVFVQMHSMLKKIANQQRSAGPARR